MPPRRATAAPPPAYCRWSTTSCASSPPDAWATRPPARPPPRPPWSPRRTSPWSRPRGRTPPTALVHEAYLRLVASPGTNASGSPGFAGRGHFFAAAAEAMRRILIDRARRKRAARHGGGRRHVPLDEAHRVAESPDHLLALD